MTAPRCNYHCKIELFLSCSEKNYIAGLKGSIGMIAAWICNTTSKTARPPRPVLNKLVIIEEPKCTLNEWRYLWPSIWYPSCCSLAMRRVHIPTRTRNLSFRAKQMMTVNRESEIKIFRGQWIGHLRAYRI